MLSKTNKTKFLILLVVAMLCTSCSVVSSEPENQNPEESIVESESETVIPEPVSQETNYLDSITTGTSQLFYSEVDNPNDNEAKQIREDLCSGISTFASVKIRTILDSTVTFLRFIIQYSGDEKQFWDDLNVKVSFPLQNGEPITIEGIVSDLQGIKECIRYPKAKSDIETAQLLILDSERNKNMDGLFFAHHILSDLAYWGYLYDMDMRESTTWEGPVETKERDIFYGITSIWGFEYPASVTEIVSSTSYTDIESNYSSELAKQVEEKNQTISKMLSEMKHDDLSLLKEKLNAMNETLAKIVYAEKTWDYSLDPHAQEIQSSHAELLDDVNTCLKTSQGGMLKDDLKYVERKLNEVYEISNSNSTNPMADQKYCFYWCKRTVNELLKIVLANDSPIDYNDPYYGMTTVLEGTNAIRQ